MSTEFDAFDADVLVNQGSRFVLLAASDGHTVWDVKHQPQDPLFDSRASQGVSHAFRFDTTLIFSELRQGNDYVTKFGALDVRTGALKWQHFYQTTFEPRKTGNHLLTRIEGKMRELSITDGSMLPLRADEYSRDHAERPTFPYGPPISVHAWNTGYLGYCNYEASEMYSGDMKGGLRPGLLEEGGRKVDRRLERQVDGTHERARRTS
ncbi:MAG TPA: hypothetical protein VG944_15940 [Fimbriimonas sp.]|nr:hypothetical protein [Fimbriimonas sp.]